MSATHPDPDRKPATIRFDRSTYDEMQRICVRRGTTIQTEAEQAVLEHFFGKGKRDRKDKVIEAKAQILREDIENTLPDWLRQLDQLGSARGINGEHRERFKRLMEE